MAAVHYTRAEKTLAVHADWDLKRFDTILTRLRRLVVFGLASGVLLLAPADPPHPEPATSVATGPFVLPTILEIANLTGDPIPTPAFPTSSPVPQAFIDRYQPAQPDDLDSAQ